MGRRADGNIEAGGRQGEGRRGGEAEPGRRHNIQKELEAERERVGDALDECDHRMPKQSDRS